MKVQDFKIAYEKAKLANIVEDEWFNTMGWFWVRLTENQMSRMFNLMKSQGAKVYKSDREDFKYYIQLKNGMKIYQ